MGGGTAPRHGGNGDDDTDDGEGGDDQDDGANDGDEDDHKDDDIDDYNDGGGVRAADSEGKKHEEKEDPYLPPRRYHAVMTLHMPYLALEEPLEVWTDLDAGQQRIDYWGDLNRFFLNRSGTGCEMLPESLDGFSSVEVANPLPPWEPAPLFPRLDLAPQADPLAPKNDVLLHNASSSASRRRASEEEGAPAAVPNGDHAPAAAPNNQTVPVPPQPGAFTRAVSRDHVVVRGIECEVWELVEPSYDPKAHGFVGRYTYLVSAADKRPVRLSFVGHNTVTNSHFDNYTFDVLQFDTGPDAVSVPRDLAFPPQCREVVANAAASRGGGPSGHGPTATETMNGAPAPRFGDGNAAAASAGDDGRGSEAGADLDASTGSGSGSTGASTSQRLASFLDNLEAMLPACQRAQQARTRGWDAYAQAFPGKSAAGGEEEGGSRRALLRHTQRLVESHNCRTRTREANSGSISYRLEVNHMADWTEAEKRGLRGAMAAAEDAVVSAERSARASGWLHDYELPPPTPPPPPPASPSRSDDGGEGQGGQEAHAGDGVEGEKGESGGDPAEVATPVEGAGLPRLPPGMGLALPPAVDWRLARGTRTHGSSMDEEEFAVVGPVKDQGMCGSCWSFGSAGAVETHAAIRDLALSTSAVVPVEDGGGGGGGDDDKATPPVSGLLSHPPHAGAKTGAPRRIRPLYTLSEQALIDCSWPEGNHGCGGGDDALGYLWSARHPGGLPSTETYGPYLNANGACHVASAASAASASTTNGSVAVAGVVQVARRNPLLLRAALAYEGPVSVRIDASPPSFYYYAGGVYDGRAASGGGGGGGDGDDDGSSSSTASACGSAASDADHIVMLVGYGTDAESGKDFWLLRNSWSSYWGEGGYMRLAVEGNICGASNHPTFPKLPLPEST